MSSDMLTVELLEGTDNCPNKTFDGPALRVEGWKLAIVRPAYIDRRVLRLRKGGQRLTTKGGI